MLAFIQVAEEGGFAPAARSLAISTSAVSRQVMELEDWLGKQLLSRTTRHVSLTDAGRDYLEQCRDLVTAMDELEAQARDQRQEPQGKLRMTAPMFMGRKLLGPMLPGFLAQYPAVEVELKLLDRFVNLIDEGFDLALRIGKLQDSTLIARKIGDFKISLVASPGYLEQSGEPKSFSDLKQHNCLVDSAPEHGARWPLERKGKSSLRISGNFTVNDGELVRDLALAGSGVALLPTFFVENDVVEGKLTSLISDQMPELDAGIYLVYPQAKYLSNTIRAFIDYVVALGEV